MDRLGLIFGTAVPNELQSVFDVSFVDDTRRASFVFLYDSVVYSIHLLDGKIPYLVL